MERKQCHVCYAWFENEASHVRHNDQYPSGCKEHYTCFQMELNYNHACDQAHTHCFVFGCKTKYAEGYWPDRDIEEHVYYAHTPNKG